MSQYLKLIKQLYRVNLKATVRPGLLNTKRLNQAIGLPDSSFESVHIAGTNGKGSVAVKTAKCLELAGYKVGLFTSPHISTFRERIKINGEMISEQDTVALLSEIFSIMENKGINATFFEVITVLAFTYFAEQEVDYGVIETGLGGRLDATNIINPKLAVITSISMDHADLLGDTLEKIAQEKAGIMKPGVPVVLGPNTPFIPRTKLCHVVPESYNTPEEENRAIVRQVMSCLDITIDPKGLEARLPCRFEEINCEGVKITFDIAHNENGLERLFINLKGKPQQVVCGISSNKDIKTCMDIIGKNAKHMFLVTAQNGRGVPLRELSKVVKGSFSEHVSINEAMHLAIKKAKKLNHDVLVCGTCFIMSDAREAVGIVEPRDPVELNEKF